jgi:hypothetical protein
MKAKISQFIKLHNEWLGLPLALFIYWITPQLLRMVDSTAGQYDLGQLQTVSFSVVKVLVASFIAFLGSALNYPLLFRFFIGPMEKRIVFGRSEGFKEVASTTLPTAELELAWQRLVFERDKFRTKVALGIYFLYFGGALFAMQTV